MGRAGWLVEVVKLRVGPVGVRLPFHDQNMAGRWLQFARASWSKPVALARVSVPES